MLSRFYTYWLSATYLYSYVYNFHCFFNLYVNINVLRVVFYSYYGTISISQTFEKAKEF